MALRTDATFDSGHTDQVHDSQLDYYGKRLATCSSDRLIKLFEVSAESQTFLCDLVGHEGPVWQVCWSHPKFGALLASCSFDRTVRIWKEAAENVWQPVYTSPPTLHDASVNSVCWAPHEVGLMLACASSDGSLSVISHNAEDGTWSEQKVPGAHSVGCMSVSWAPATPPGSLVVGAAAPQAPVRRLASCGCDNLVKLWVWSEQTGTWAEEAAPLVGHTDWVRCVAWAPNVGLPMNTLASCGQDGKVIIWTQHEPGGPFTSKLLSDYAGTPVWSVSWSPMGNILAVSDGNNQVKIWKEGIDLEWNQLTDVEA